MSDPIRVAFEAWFEADAMPSEADLFRREDDNPDEYYHGVTHRAWLAWQASRAAAIEEAAKACEERGAMFDDEDAIASIAAELCASRIRAMVKP